METYWSLPPTIILAASLAWSTGCAGDDTPAAAGASEDRFAASPADAPPALSPTDIVRLLQSLHQQRAYDRIAPLVAKPRRSATLRLLRAIDDVIDANAALQRAANARYPGPAAGTWDLAAMSDNLGPFSTQIRMINQRFQGDRATVTLQEADHIPLVHAEFERVGGRWQYRPEPTPASMVPELDELARILRDIEESVRGGAPPATYRDAFVHRVLPQLYRVMTITDPQAQTAAAGSVADPEVYDGRARRGVP